MRDLLAERLLAKVMNWTSIDVARERPILQALAWMKYDEYQQFSPGMRFVESFALWLEQFQATERQIAYDFIRSRLVFLSEAEMAHFAAVIYPDLIRPILLARAALADSMSPFRVAQVAQGVTFKHLEATTLFFGLSDGARVDQFRRSNRELSHEQIFASYDLPRERVEELRPWLDKRNALDVPVPLIVLLDDFAGSGTSYFREEDGKLQGKLAKFLRRISSSPEWANIVKFPDTSIVIALYVATSQAHANLREGVVRLTEQFGAKLDLVSVQLLESRVSITQKSAEAFVPLIERYYDAALEDDHTRKGKTDLKYGFAAGGLPLVLHHNTPNNSLFLLGAENGTKIRSLFPRFRRHRSEI